MKYRSLFLMALLLSVIMGCSLDSPDYIGMVQGQDSSFPGVKVKQYVEDLSKASKSAGNKSVSGGWTKERASGGHLVKYWVEENGQDLTFVWLVDDQGRITPQNKLASDATRQP